MLSILALIGYFVFSFLEMEARSGSLTESTLKGRQQEVQQEAALYQEELSRIQTQAQDQIKEEGFCHMSKPCWQTKDLQKNEKSSLDETKTTVVFVSSSLPLESLKVLAYQAKQYQAQLVIRGMVNGSLQQTADLVKEIGYPLDIDPKLFQTYGIEKVPAFLVYHKGQWHQVQGNVELSFALETVRQTRSSRTAKS